VQLIKGEVGDPGKAREALDRWLAELADGATGWIGRIQRPFTQLAGIDQPRRLDPGQAS
jgi:hypothetical protein